MQHSENTSQPASQPAQESCLKSKGFAVPATAGISLVELSIVLVIIALVTAGILTTQQMIHTAQLKKIGTQMDQYRTAVKLFVTKYDCIPGDCPNATSYFGTYASCGNNAQPTSFPAGTCNGDGNGIVGPSSYGGGYVASTAEWLLFWNHLSNSGLITGNFGCVTGVDPVHDYYKYICSPLVPVPSGGTPTGNMGPRTVLVTVKNGVQYTKGGYGIVAAKRNEKAYFLVGSGATLQTINFDTAFTPNDARWIDTVFDDGVPSTGIITASNGGGWQICTNGSYLNSDLLTPNTSASSRGCILFWDVGS